MKAGVVHIERKAGTERREDEEILAARVRYAADEDPPGTLHAAIYRSPYAHARIRGVDLTRALGLPGVVYGLTARTLPPYAKPMSPFPFQTTDPFLQGNPTIKFFPHYGLASDKVRFVGEPVAVIVAEDRYVAEDALELIDAEYDPLPAVVDEELALTPESPVVYEGWGDNVMLRFRVAGGDADRAFAAADMVLREKIKSHRFAATPIEPRAILARYDPGSHTLDLRDSTQIPHVIATVLEASLDIPHLKVRVRSSPVGGGFGTKWGFYPEEWLMAVLAVAVRRPVRWVELRREHLVASSHAREQTHFIEMALTRDGRILGIRDRILANAGAAYPQGAAATIITTAMFVPGAYKVEHYEATVLGVATNKAPFGAHRGFGKAEAAYVIERMMDIAAGALGLDPAEIRYRNFIPPQEFPYVSATGARYDSGNYAEALRRCLDLLEHDRWRAEQRRRRERGVPGPLLGIGFALALEPSSATRMNSYNAGYFSVTMRVDPGGRVFVFSSGNDEGQGHATAAAQLLQQELGVEPDSVVYVEGDSLLCPYGSGSYSSRFSIVGTSAVIGAARRLRAKILRIASYLLRRPQEDLAVEAGGVVSRSTGERITLRDVARAAYLRLWELPPDEDPGLDVAYHYRDPNVGLVVDRNGRVAMFSSYPYTADGAVVEIDPDTGLLRILRYVSVHDCGRVLNEAIVVGQHLGALAHGIGGALYEELPYDAGGQPLHQTFVDYLVPTAREIPDIILDHLMTPNPFTPAGLKGTGETGTVSPPPVFANAVEDALRPLGVKVRALPLRPERIWRYMRTASGQGG